MTTTKKISIIPVVVFLVMTPISFSPARAATISSNTQGSSAILASRLSWGDMVPRDGVEQSSPAVGTASVIDAIGGFDMSVWIWVLFLILLLVASMTYYRFVII